jgi:hypothetical protein
MNKFDAVIRQQFLCMKIPVPKGVIEDQEHPGGQWMTAP